MQMYKMWPLLIREESPTNLEITGFIGIAEASGAIIREMRGGGGAVRSVSNPGVP